MSCRDIRARFLEGGMTEEVEQHVQSCSACSIEFEQLDSLRDVLGDDAVWAEPPPDLGDQIAAAIAPAALTRTPPGRRWWMAVAALLVAVVAVGATAVLRDREPEPDWEVTLIGEGIAAGGTAVVKAYEYPLGTELYVMPVGIPRSPDGTYYELWFGNDESIISAGTFASEFPVTLYIAALRDEYPLMGVTIEPRDDDPGSSGDVILRQP